VGTLFNEIYILDINMLSLRMYSIQPIIVYGCTMLPDDRVVSPVVPMVELPTTVISGMLTVTLPPFTVTVAFALPVAFES
jgi:hypothetical protein